MNRGKNGSKPDEEVPDEFRCKRSDGKQWRCPARAMEGRTLCEKHHNQAKKRSGGGAAAAASSSPTKKMKLASNNDPSRASESKSKVSNRQNTLDPARPKPPKAQSLSIPTSIDAKLQKDSPNGQPKVVNGTSKKNGDDSSRISRSPSLSSRFLIISGSLRNILWLTLLERLFSALLSVKYTVSSLMITLPCMQGLFYALPD